MSWYQDTDQNPSHTNTISLPLYQDFGIKINQNTKPNLNMGWGVRFIV